MAALTLIVLTAAAGGGEWVELTDRLKAHDAGVRRGAVAVDANSGAVYVLGKQAVHVSDDAGQTWRTIGRDVLRGQNWYAAALQNSPAGPGLAVFLKADPNEPYASAMTLDGGRTWRTISRVTVSDRRLHCWGWSWGQVGFGPARPTFVLARMHHSRRMWASEDAGRTWRELPLATAHMGLYDPRILVAARPKRRELLRSADAGRTWETVARLPVATHRPVRRGKRLTWLLDDGLAYSEDAGRTWQRANAPAGGRWGPCFGRDDRDMVVATLDAVYRTTNAGRTWRRLAANHAVAVCPNYKGERFRMDWFVGATAFALDTERDRLYLATFNRLFRLDLAE